MKGVIKMEIKEFICMALEESQAKLEALQEGQPQTVRVGSLIDASLL